MDKNKNTPVPENTQPSDDRLRDAIISNTPDGQDPLVYWHGVAVDAIRRNDELQVIAKKRTDERDAIKSDLDRFTKRLINQATVQKTRIPLDISTLVSMAQSGNIDLTLSIGIKSGKSGKIGISPAITEVSDGED